MKKVFLILLCFNIYLNADENIKFYNPSFDCNKVKKDSIEYEICINKDLSLLDKELSETYKKITNNQNIEESIKINIKDEQKNWLIDIRNNCNNISCLKYVYTNKITELKSVIYKYNDEFLKIETKIENDDYKKCLSNSNGGSLAWKCNESIMENYENLINLLNIEIINSIQNNKNGIFEELPTYYDKNKMKEFRLNLENIYKSNIENWQKYSLTYYEYLNNTYGIQDGTMWIGISDRYKIEFLKNRIKMLLNIKNKIEKGN